jgi:hypothetical protein
MTPGGSSTEHICTKQYIEHKKCIEKHVIGNSAGCGLSLPSYTLAFFLQLRKRQGKTHSVWDIWCCYLQNPKNFFWCKWTLNCWFSMCVWVCVSMHVYMYVYNYVCMYLVQLPKETYWNLGVCEHSQQWTEFWNRRRWEARKEVSTQRRVYKNKNERKEQYSH